MGQTIDGSQPPTPPQLPQPPEKKQGEHNQNPVQPIAAKNIVGAKETKTTSPVSEKAIQERIARPEQASIPLKVIPTSVDSGLNVRFYSIAEPVEFHQTRKGVLPDKTPDTPTLMEMRDRHIPGRIATGANGFVQAASLEGDDGFVMKRSYCSQDKWNGEIYTLYFDAAAISREAGVLTGLKSIASDHFGYQNIVPFHGAGVAESGEPLILLARADSALSGQLMDKSKDSAKPDIPKPPLAREKVISYSRDLFAGLSCLASVQLVHQDLKPENLLIKGDTLWIADYGEATCNDGFAALGIDGKKLSMEDRRAGTGATKPFFPKYEPPAPATDVWAGGLVVMHMLNPAKAEEYIKRLHNQPLESKGSNGIPFNELTDEELSKLTLHCQRTVKEFLNETLGDSDQPYKTILETLMNQILDPNPNTRIPASDIYRQLEVIVTAMNEKKQGDSS